ncbi:MAG: restriction endonuclease [Acidimicrobiia bacterium]|nr:restriction endonuclease [Acidimicrobiia bacterium]
MAAKIPKWDEVLWPTIRAMRELGGSANIGEIAEKVIEQENFTPEQQAVMHGDGPQSEIEYRLAWARTHLKNVGALENSARGVWALTEFGRTATEAETVQADKNWRKTYFEEYRQNRTDEPGLPEDDEPTWEDELLECLLKMEPEAFERLAQRLLREAGFRNVEVTERTGDGGIDGMGVYRLSLVSFPTYFQCKRYKGTVGAGAVRDFRGAMTGRGEKGLIITTGSFSAQAREEATRDGAPPIDLVDGDDLCQLLRDHGLGVRVTRREVCDVEVDSEFFLAV